MPSPKYKAANGRSYLIEPVPDIITGETIGYRASGPDGLECPEEGDPAVVVLHPTEKAAKAYLDAL